MVTAIPIVTATVVAAPAPRAVDSPRKSMLIRQLKAMHPGARVSDANISKILDHGKDIHNTSGVFKEKSDLVRSIGIRDSENAAVAYGATVQHVMSETGIRDEKLVIEILEAGSTLKSADAGPTGIQSANLNLYSLRADAVALSASLGGAIDSKTVGAILGEGALMAQDRGLFGAHKEFATSEGNLQASLAALSKTVDTLAEENPGVSKEMIKDLLVRGQDHSGVLKAYSRPVPTESQGPGLPPGVPIRERSALQPFLPSINMAMAQLKDNHPSVSEEKLGAMLSEGVLMSQGKGEYGRLLLEGHSTESALNELTHKLSASTGIKIDDVKKLLLSSEKFAKAVALSGPLPGMPTGNRSILLRYEPILKKKVALLRLDSKFDKFTNEQLGHIVAQGLLANKKAGLYQEQKDQALRGGISDINYPFAMTIGHLATNLNINTDQGRNENPVLIKELFQMGSEIGMMASPPPLSPFVEFESELAPVIEKINGNAGDILGDLGFPANPQAVKELIAFGALAAVGKGPFQSGSSGREAAISEKLASLKKENISWSRALLLGVMDMGKVLESSIKSAKIESENKRLMTEEMGTFLGEFGLTMDKVKGDGNCFYRAVAVASGKTQEEHASYRESVIGQLLESGAPGTVLERAMTDKAYAEREEVLAMSKALKRPIIIVAWRGSLDKEQPPLRAGTPAASVQPIGFDDPEIRGKPPIVVTLASNHYNVVPSDGIDLSRLIARAF